MSSFVDLDRAALILVEAAFFGEKPTAKRWGINISTVRNYRARLHTDSDFANLFALKKRDFEQANWAGEIPAAIRNAVRFLERAAQEIEVSPESAHAIAGALKILAEVQLTKEILDVRLARHFRESGQEDSQVVRGAVEGRSEGG